MIADAIVLSLEDGGPAHPVRGRRPSVQSVADYALMLNRATQNGLLLPVVDAAGQTVVYMRFRATSELVVESKRESL